jgi:peptidyl-tRNA hydrolase
MTPAARSARRCASSISSPDDVIVIHDEIDLAPGKLRVKTGGGVAGHNGLRSIGAHIGPIFTECGSASDIRA